MRPLIGALMLFLGSLPYLLGARPFASPSLPRTACCDPSTPLMSGTTDQWFDFGKTIAGTLIGAGLAFLINLYMQRRTRTLDQIAAANAAGATIARMYNGFLNVRRSLREERVLHDQEAPAAPMWLFSRPVLQHLRSDLAIDFDSLTFMFEIGDVETFQKLHAAQAAYDDMMGYLERLEELASEKQKRVEGADCVDAQGNIDLGRAAVAIGPRLVGQLGPVVDGLHEKAERDEPIYLEASHALFRAVRQRFGSRIRVIRVAGARV